MALAHSSTSPILELLSDLSPACLFYRSQAVVGIQRELERQGYGWMHASAYGREVNLLALVASYRRDDAFVFANCPHYSRKGSYQYGLVWFALVLVVNGDVYE